MKGGKNSIWLMKLRYEEKEYYEKNGSGSTGV